MEVEFNLKFKREVDTFVTNSGSMVSITPPLGSDYWIFRVPLSTKQAVIAFPKFFTFGIGFQEEENWNTNLPYSCDAERIFSHISCNKGDESINDDDCILAIKMIQEKLKEYFV